MIDANKNNIKETWKIINSLTNRKKKGNNLPDEFKDANALVSGDKNIADKFNQFFVNVGPSLAKKYQNVISFSQNIWVLKLTAPCS